MHQRFVCLIRMPDRYADTDINTAEIYLFCIIFTGAGFVNIIRDFLPGFSLKYCQESDAEKRRKVLSINRLYTFYDNYLFFDFVKF